MRILKNKKIYLVTHGDIGGKQTRTIFTRKMRAFRFAAQLRTSFFVNGEEGKFVETKSIGPQEFLALNLKVTKEV